MVECQKLSNELFTQKKKVVSPTLTCLKFQFEFQKGEKKVRKVAKMPWGEFRDSKIGFQLFSFEKPVKGKPDPLDHHMRQV